MNILSFTDCQWVQWIACYSTWKPKISKCTSFVPCCESFHCSCISKWADSSCPVSVNQLSAFYFILYYFTSPRILFISGMPLLPAASWKIYMFCLSNHWEPMDMCYMWVCWLWKVRLNPCFVMFYSFSFFYVFDLITTIWKILIQIQGRACYNTLERDTALLFPRSGNKTSLGLCGRQLCS